MERVDLSDVIRICGEDIPYKILRPVMYAPTETHSGPSPVFRRTFLRKYLTALD